MKLSTLKGKKVTVMGLGLHGGALGTIEWLLKQGAVITVTDTKTSDQLRESVEKLKKYSGITFVLGAHREEDFLDADLIVRNPSVARNSKYLELARSHNIPVEMDSSLFFQYTPTQNIIGVTGSKGKTTTSNAIAILLKEFNPATVAVGVDGVSPLKELSVIKSDSPVVFELSSWRLEALAEHAVSPHISVVTSIYRDHLNTYASFEEYIETKKTIVRFQKAEDIAVLNFDDPIIREWGSELKSTIYGYSLQALPANVDGIYIDSGKVCIRKDQETVELFSTSVLPLHFPHEQRNLLPGILIAHLFGMPPEHIATALSRIHGLPHRLEKVREFKGVTYINDSAATMPDATIAALTSLKEKSLVHIIGGSDKNLLFEDLAKAIATSNIRTLIFLPGTATERMKEVIKPLTKAHISDVSSMEEAVEKASRVAQEGDIVLLSPGATSFGLFLHEFDRGQKFRHAVHALY